MFTISKEQTLALSGLYQSLSLVQQVAWEGDKTHSCLIPTLDSILKMDVKDFIDPYGSYQNLSLGFRALKDTLENRRDRRVIERTRYAINLMYLENRLNTDQRTSSSLGGQLERLHTIYHPIEDSIDEVIQELGVIYRELISPLGPKIIVEGNPSYLKVENNASLIRALLLAGIRAIVLWRQAHGKRWALLFGRSSILKNLEGFQRLN